MIDGGLGGDEEAKLKVVYIGNIFKIFWCEGKKRKRVIIRE